MMFTRCDKHGVPCLVQKFYRSDPYGALRLKLFDGRRVDLVYNVVDFWVAPMHYWSSMTTENWFDCLEKYCERNLQEIGYDIQI